MGVPSVKIEAVSKRSASLCVRLRIDVCPASSIGPGKIGLLEHIEACGSLSEAARELGMSYRRAWLLLDDLNHAFAHPVTTASIGGAGGGGARLTEFGRKLIAAYRDIERSAQAEASTRLAWLLAGGVQEPVRGSTRRPLARPVSKR